MDRTLRYRITDILKSGKFGLVLYVLGRNLFFFIDNTLARALFRKSFIAFGLPDNSLYGLNKFIDIQKPFNSFVEHGAFLGDYIHPVELQDNVTTIHCMGRRRAEYLRKVFPDKDIVRMPPLMSAVDRVEPPLGDCIGVDYALVIMTHSTASLSARNSNLWLHELSASNSEVVVLLYYMDWHQADELRKLGVKVVTNGHKYDANFLPRMKDVLQKAKVVYTDNVGSHIGYSVSLDTKVEFLRSDCHFVAKSDEGVNQLNKENTHLRNQVVSDIERAFLPNSDFGNSHLTKEQLKIVDEWW